MRLSAFGNEDPLQHLLRVWPGAPEAGRRPEPRHQGSTELVNALLANDLVDAMSLFTVPVVLGGGKKRLRRWLGAAFVQADQVLHLSNGLIVGHYEREGEIKIGNTAVDSPSDREVARRSG